MSGGTNERQFSEIGGIDAGRIVVRGRGLTDELMGSVTFTQMIYLTITGDVPDPPAERLLDAILVSLVDHGVTGSSLAARITIRSAPEALQGAVAAGLLNAGGRVLGSMEGCGRVLDRFAPENDEPDALEAAARRAVAELAANGGRIAGLGHTLHEKGDQRADRLFTIAGEVGLRSRYIGLLEAMAGIAGERAGKKIPINVTGAVAASLLEMGIDWRLFRGFGLMSRVVGLVAHVQEERDTGRLGALIHQLQQPGAWDSIGPNS
jgi:citrate synthase